MKPDKRLVSLSAEAFSVYAPPQPMDIVAWCERYRRLSPEASAEPGPYRISRAPFFAEVMRACADPKVREVVVMGASQIAKTESCILNVLAYKIANDPAPSLLVTSTLPACHSLSHDRFEPMVRDCEPLRDLVAESGAPSSESTIYRKTFPDGHLTLVGSNSASGLARMPIRDLYLTEVDRFAVEAGRGEGEGDPVSLARIRTSTFHDSKVIMESSPTIAGRSRIEAAYLNSTQEHWYNACPNCGFFQILTFGRIDFLTLFHQCEHCGEKLNQPAWQSSPGEWRAHAGHPTIRGFQISALASPLISWSTIVEEFKVANRLAGEGDPS
jgi:phage terminase large subunit GpA-like protein